MSASTTTTHRFNQCNHDNFIRFVIPFLQKLTDSGSTLSFSNKNGDTIEENIINAKKSTDLHQLETTSHNAASQYEIRINYDQKEEQGCRIIADDDGLSLLYQISPREPLGTRLSYDDLIHVTGWGQEQVNHVVDHLYNVFTGYTSLEFQFNNHDLFNIQHHIDQAKKTTQQHIHQFQETLSYTK